MLLARRFVLLAIAITFSSVSLGQARVADAPGDEKTTTTVITSLPEIDTAIHDAMQSRSYGDAVKLIETILGKGDSAAPDYLRYLQALALTEAKRYDDAISTFERLETEHPASQWISRSRFGRAHVYVLRRQYIDAGAIYGQEAERLLSRGRKDTLCKIYLEFADRYFEGLPTDDPAKAQKPDYKQALTYYSEAVTLGPTVTLRQKIDFRVARCQQELGQNDEAIGSYQRFLDQYADHPPKPSAAAPNNIQAEARYRLGSVQLTAGQSSLARKTWQDFLSQWKAKADDEQATVQSYLSRAEYRLAHTYGLPQPSSIGDLELAVTAAEKFLANHPGHTLAPKAELEIAQGYSRHRRHAQAVARLRSLIDNPRYGDSPQVPVARQMLGQEFVAQGKFDEAIAAWKVFLERHPTDPKWPSVQARIVDTEYAKANDALASKKYQDARTMWQTFLNKYPLDARAPAVLLQFGQMKYAEAVQLHAQRLSSALQNGDSPQSVDLSDACRQLFSDAIADWRRVLSKYPDGTEASRAAYMIGVTLEDRLEKLKQALDSYKQVKGDYAPQASGRIARLTSPQLELITERKFRSDEKPRIKLTTRNLEQVSVKMYRVDMVDYFRKMHLASGVETLDIALIDPDHQFEYTIEAYDDFKQIDGDIELSVDGPGVTAVTVSSEKLEATTMVVVSDLDMIVKSSRNELFLFVENMSTGEPVQGVSVLISDGSKVFAEEITGPDGILQKNYAELKSVRDLRLFAVQAGHMASTVNNLNGLDFAVGLTPRGYLYTDRPAYRAGQLVNIKAVVRWVDQDRFTFQPGEEFKLDVYDARGRQLQTKVVALNAYGTLHSNILLPKASPQGDYRVHLHRASSGEADQTGELSFETQFKVTEYKLEPVQISIDLEKDVYYRGEKVKGSIDLKYYYGTPLAGETLEYRFGPDAETVTAKTDQEGKIAVEFDTQRFSESQPLQLSVMYRERGLAAAETVYLATRGFALTASSMRDVYINGESFETLFKVADPAGNPVETKLKIEVFLHTLATGRHVEKLVGTHEQTTDPQFGEARQTLELDEGGIYSVRATAVDQFGNQVSGENKVRISGHKDSTRLRILADRHTYKVGEEADINLHWREQPALALVTFEGASVLAYKLVDLKSGDNKLQIPMESEFAPNIYLSVAVMQRNRFHAVQSEFRVSQQLRVTLKPDQAELKPGEDLSVQIEVTDPQGNPVAAELSLALVQTNLLNAFNDIQGAIDTFFTSGHRETSVRQSSSCTFSYRPKTRGVSQFLLAEADRRETLEREVRALADLGGSVSGERGGEAIARFGDFSDSNGDVSLEWARVAGDLIVRDQPAGGVAAYDLSVPMVHRSQMGRGQVAGQALSAPRFRTEIRDGRQVQVPYTGQAAVDSWSRMRRRRIDITGQPPTTGQLPTFSFGTSFQRSDLFRGGGLGGSSGENQQQTHVIAGFAGVSGPGPGQINFDVSEFSSAKFGRHFGEDYTVNGLTSAGKFLTVNGLGDGEEIEQLVREQGLQILPAMAHAETAFWDPMFVTDATGKATVTITMPNRSTAWRLRAKGINGQTLAGEATAEVITKRDLFGEMKLPLAFTVGDKADVPVQIHNSVDGARSIAVKLTATLGDKSTTQSRTFDVQGPGISDVVFPVEIDDTDEALFELSVSGGDDLSDDSARVVAVRAYGFPVYQTASGTSSQSTLALIDFDEKLQADGAALEIVIGANVNRALLESVLGGGFYPLQRCGLPSPSPIERSVSDVLGGIGLLEMIGDARDSDTPEAQALTGRISSAITQLTAAQRDDGGWSWSGGVDGDADQYLSSRVMWALSAARSAGFAVSGDPFDKGKAFLQGSFASASQRDLERQTILLHAMAVSDCSDFAFANRLYRERNRLSPSGLTYLALTLAVMNHHEMAGDLLELIKSQLDGEQLADQNRAPSVPWMRNRVESQAMYLLALQEINPDHGDVAKLAKELMAARIGSRWPVEKSNGPAISALARWHARTRHVSEKYRLTIAVNDREIETLTIDPSNEGSRRIRVPADVLRSDKPQRIEFELDGRATFSYSALLTGFVAADKIASTTKTWTVNRRYEPAARIFDGRSVPRGFRVVNGSYRSFTNPLTQVPVGDRGEVTISPRRLQTTGRTGEEYDYLVLTEPIPGGCTILDGSVSGPLERYEIEPGQITFYIGNRRHPGDIRYTLVGYTPGQFRAPQSILRSFYEPSQFAVSKVNELTVLQSGSKTVDVYRLSPDELYYLGQKEFVKGNYDAAHTHLTELFDNWQLDADEYKNTVRWLFSSSLARNNHGDTVKYFELLNERFPDVEISFEDILRVAKSYRELAEYERSYLVYRATVEGSFERESQVAGFLNARGEFVRSVQTMERLLRDYPAESYVATASYSLAQETYRRAPKAKQDERLKAAGLTRVHLIDAAIQMLDHFVTAWPQDPANDQASFALATALIDLEQYEAAITRSEKYTQRYPRSLLLDSFWYMIGYSHFELEHPQEALEMCRKVAEATFRVPETGGTRAAENRWEAIYIMGQIYHSLGEAANAIAQYTKVKERFADATEAIKFFSRKDIALDEVTTIKSSDAKKVELRFRNIGEAAIKVYRIDLMKFGLMQRNLDRITAINLAGIQPYHEETVRLGDGKDYRDRSKQLALPLNEEGAYLIVCRGDNLYASGLVLVSPLTLLVQEDATSGRVRVSVKDTTDDSFVSDVHVKVIGSANDDFVSGDTDLRGLFIADDVKGSSTVIAVRDANRYAFYRGKIALQGLRPEPAVTPGDPFGSQAPEQAQVKAKSGSGKGVLRYNLFRQNGLFQEQQRDNYDELLNNDRSGVKSKEAF